MTENLRVLMVSEPGKYGVLFYVRALIGWLHQAHPNITVDYAYSSARNSPDNEDLVAAVKGQGGETFDMQVSSMPQAGDVGAVKGLWELVRRAKPDVVHAHSSKAGALARGLAVFPGFPPVLYSPHGYYGMSMRGGPKDRLFNGLESLLGRIGWTHNISIHERKFGVENLRIPPEKALLIFSGVDLERFRPPAEGEKQTRRRELGLPLDARLLVTVGRDVYEKNYRDLYWALDQVLPDTEGVFFAHAGGGTRELRESLSPAAREKVKVFSFLEEPEHLLQAADGFALVSRTEAFGLVAYEALGCGLPLILTGTMGLLTLKELAFPGVRWIPNPAEHGDVSASIAAAIRDWAASSSEHLPDRRQIERYFDQRTQFDKLTLAYRAIARRQIPANTDLH